MKKIKDKTGRDWTFAVDYEGAKRVLDLSGISIFESNFEQLIGDPLKFINVLYCLVKPEADARGIDGAAFGELMVFPGVWPARDALAEEVISFFRLVRPREAEVLASAWAKLQEVDNVLRPKVIEKAEKTVSETDVSKLASLLDSTGSDTSTSSPELSVSTTAA